MGEGRDGIGFAQPRKPAECVRTSGRSRACAGRKGGERRIVGARHGRAARGRADIKSGIGKLGQRGLDRAYAEVALPSLGRA
jgi:hypothetical protein